MGASSTHPSTGSSPRVRGKPGPGLQEAARRGLIPARAGKTRTPAPMRAARWAHPRACGENVVMRLGPGKLAGSSPRVRGKPHGPVLSGQERGLIPARAGKTASARTPSCARTAHPRACGENWDLTTEDIPALGSSPRVRGKPHELVFIDLSLGLIPARAGKTGRIRHVLGVAWAHPRACGENLRGGGRPSPFPGSSPRVRGKPKWEGARSPPSRLIPARAGKTGLLTNDRSARGAHPRACGENRQSGKTHALGPGSSPRVRGKPI